MSDVSCVNALPRLQFPVSSIQHPASVTSGPVVELSLEPASNIDTAVSAPYIWPRAPYHVHRAFCHPD
jgi:hypothetical protein